LWAFFFEGGSETATFFFWQHGLGCATMLHMYLACDTPMMHLKTTKNTPEVLLASGAFLYMGLILIRPNQYHQSHSDIHAKLVCNV
jgi:hypothetical protein